MTEREPDFDGVPVDRVTIPQDRLNIENKHRSNLFPWNGQFSPQLVEALLKTYVKRKALILDPFVGSGTVLCEAGRLNFPACGAEINPAACRMAQAYRFMNVPVKERVSMLDKLEALIEDVVPGFPFGLFSKNGDRSEQKTKRSLVRLHTELAGTPLQPPLETLIVLLDFYKGDLMAERLSATWEKLKERIHSFPHASRPITVFNCDARKLPLRDKEVSYVLTSPPYINVFNYHQQYRGSVEAIGWDLLQVAKSEIGSNRKHRGNRYLTVIQYCLDMTEVLKELERVCKKGARIIMVIGRESSVRKTQFFNAEIMAALATRCVGFWFTARQERVFRNKFGALIYEDILHFVSSDGAPLFLESPYSVAKEVLANAKMRAPKESQADLEEALSQVGAIKPSHIYDDSEAFANATNREKVKS